MIWNKNLKKMELRTKLVIYQVQLAALPYCIDFLLKLSKKVSIPLTFGLDISDRMLPGLLPPYVDHNNWYNPIRTFHAGIICVLGSLLALPFTIPHALYRLFRRREVKGTCYPYEMFHRVWCTVAIVVGVAMMSGTLFFYSLLFAALIYPLIKASLRIFSGKLMSEHIKRALKKPGFSKYLHIIAFSFLEFPSRAFAYLERWNREVIAWLEPERVKHEAELRRKIEEIKRELNK